MLQFLINMIWTLNNKYTAAPSIVATLLSNKINDFPVTVALEFSEFNAPPSEATQYYFAKEYHLWVALK